MNIPKRYIYTPSVRNIVRNNARSLSAEVRASTDHPLFKKSALAMIRELKKRVLDDLKELS